MRRFYLIRHADPSGVSGTGRVAQGVEFDDGSVAIRWTGRYPSTSTWENGVHDAIAIHGHGGKTVIHYLDDFNTEMLDMLIR